jgi:hypothetical protein
MAQPPNPIDPILTDLRQDLTNTLTLLNIAFALRRNSRHLLHLLRSMMIELCEHIDQALPLLPEEEGDGNA